MIKLEITESRMRSFFTSVGASIIVCALAAPAFALPTAFGTNPSGAGVAGLQSSKYDRLAPLAGQQYAGEEDENEVQPYNGEEAEHMRHEEEEHEGREELHHLGQEGEEHAERLRNRVEEERAEHERHEMEEHRPDQDQEPENDSD